MTEKELYIYVNAAYAIFIYRTIGFFQSSVAGFEDRNKLLVHRYKVAKLRTIGYVKLQQYFRTGKSNEA